MMHPRAIAAWITTAAVLPSTPAGAFAPSQYTLWLRLERAVVAQPVVMVIAMITMAMIEMWLSLDSLPRYFAQEKKDTPTFDELKNSIDPKSSLQKSGLTYDEFLQGCDCARSRIFWVPTADRRSIPSCMPWCCFWSRHTSDCMSGRWSRRATALDWCFVARFWRILCFQSSSIQKIYYLPLYWYGESCGDEGGW